MAKKKLTLSIDEKLLDDARHRANEMGISLSAYVSTLIAKDAEERREK